MNTTPIQVTDDQFDQTVLRSELPVLVDFWAPWCGPCRLITPVLEDLAREHAGQMVVAKVNTDHEPRNALRYGVRGIPTILLFQNGREVDRVVGALPKAALREWVESSLTN